METILRILILINLLYFGIVNGTNFNVLNFGAKGDGETDDSKAFVKAWHAACSGEGNMKTLLIPDDKTFLLQPIVFQGPCESTSIKFKLDGNIVAPSDKGEWSGNKSHGWIGFTSVSGLMIVGSGKINGRGSSFWKPRLKTAKRPTALHFDKCNNLRISGITSMNSPKNHISIHSSKNVAVSNINLIAPEKSPNTDGIDISGSTNVNIFDSTIRTGDDCVAINGGSMNINITGINCGPGHGISVGSLGAHGAEDTVSNVQVTNCIFNKTMNGARIKTWQGGKGYARDISFENITVIDAKNPIIIDQNYMDKGRLDSVEEESAVAISNIRFIGFKGTTISEDAITIKCSAGTPCKDVIMDDINITMEDGENPKVDCEHVDGNSEEPILKHGCFKIV